MTTPETKPKVWPLFFSYRSPIVGRGFLAEVELLGRVLATAGDDVWLDGVNPGAFAVEAASMDVAGAALRTALTNVFIDMAADADAEEFERRVDAFFNARDDDTFSEWEEAVESIRRGDHGAPELPRFDAETPIEIRVTTKPSAELMPEDNPMITGATTPALAKAA